MMQHHNRGHIFEVRKGTGMWRWRSAAMFVIALLYFNVALVQGACGADGTFEHNGTADPAVEFTGTAAGTNHVKVEFGEYEDTARLIVLDVTLSTSDLILNKGDEVPLTCDATPDPSAIGGMVYWKVSEVSEGGGTFDPESDEDESTTFTATHAGEGTIVVQYWYGGEYAEASVPFTVTGATILDDTDDDGDEDTDDYDDNAGTDTDPSLSAYRLVFVSRAPSRNTSSRLHAIHEPNPADYLRQQHVAACVAVKVVLSSSADSGSNAPPPSEPSETFQYTMPPMAVGSGVASQVSGTSSPLLRMRSEVDSVTSSTISRAVSS